MAELDLTLNNLLIPDIVGYEPPFGTKIERDNINLGGLSTAQVNTNVIMAFTKMRPTPIGSSSTTTRVEYDARLVFNTTIQEPVTLTLGAGTYIGCCVTVYNVSDVANSVVNDNGENTFTDVLDPSSSAQYCWNGSTWIKLLTKISLAKPTHITTGDIWFDV